MQFKHKIYQLSLLEPLIVNFKILILIYLIIKNMSKLKISSAKNSMKNIGMSNTTAGSNDNYLN